MAHGEVLMRQRTLDVAKGIAIMGIVVSHTMRGLSAASIANPFEPWYEETDTALYLVHLGVFFFLSGIFVSRSVQRHGAALYLRQRLALLSWLFLVWTALQGGIQVVASRFINTPTTPADVLIGLVKPLGQLWFLPSLALFTIAVAAARPWVSGRRLYLTLALAAGVSLARWGVPGNWFFARDLGMAIFFTLGVVIGFERVIRFLKSPIAFAVGVVSGLCYAAICIATDPTPPPERFAFAEVTPGTIAAGVVASLAGLLAILVVSRFLDRVPGLGTLVAAVGRRSLPIFLAHILFTAGTRVALSRMGLTSLSGQLGMGALGGILMPIALSSLAGRTGVDWLFGSPTWWDRAWQHARRQTDADATMDEENRG